MRRKGSIFFLILAVAFAAAAAWGAHRWIINKAHREAAQRATLAPVVVAKVDLKTGAKLSERNLVVIQKPAPTLPPGHFSQVEQLKGRVLRLPVLRGQMVLVSRLALKGNAGGMSAVVPAGYRAMTVRVNEVIGVAGFVQSGDRVDVLATVDKGRFREDPATHVVLQDIPVLAVGKELPNEKEAKKAQNQRVTVVTLQVSPDQGARLALAVSEGKIVLALRNLADRGNGDASGVSLSSLVNPAVPEITVQVDENPPPQAPVTKAPPKVSVEVIKGVKRSTQTL